MTISRYETEDGLLKTPKFKVELRNAGKNDLILNLGIMLANDRKQYPNAIVLILTDQDGKSRRLELRDPAVIAGRMDPLIVPLPVGSSYSLPVDLGQVLGSGFPGVRVQIKSWKLFSCDGISGRAVSTQSANLDVKGIALMPYWEGTVCVNQLSFKGQPLISSCIPWFSQNRENQLGLRVLALDFRAFRTVSLSTRVMDMPV